MHTNPVRRAPWWPAVLMSGLLLAQGAAPVRRVYPDRPVDVPFGSRAYGMPGPDRVCIKQCEFDDNPCDPPEFKHADGRCSG